MLQDGRQLEYSRWANHRLPTICTSRFQEMWHPFCGKLTETGTVVRRAGQGHKRATTPAQDLLFETSIKKG
ncbi:hypothetical protein TNCV_573611 [Trichonephila clavipes]|nr:hypothetical protein TNCV_573611 [Trichonephila clavipes]